jgi:hypothetical protein
MMVDLRSTRTAAFGTSTVGKGLACGASTELGERTVSVGGTSSSLLSGEEAVQVERVGGSASSEREYDDTE